MNRIYVLLAALGLSLPAWAALDEAGSLRLQQVQERWAQIQYQTDEQQRAKAFEALASETEAFTQAQPNAAEAWIWHGIVTSSWAGAEGGLGALGKAKDAKRYLEKAITLDPKALNGSAYTSLGTLYDRVPGWPIGFGDEDKAAQLLRQALLINPNGIDSLYFWGDHLYRQGQYAQARIVLEKARQAPARQGRELADKGRQAEITELLITLDRKLN